MCLKFCDICCGIKFNPQSLQWEHPSHHPYLFTFNFIYFYLISLGNYIMFLQLYILMEALKSSYNLIKGCFYLRSQQPLTPSDEITKQIWKSIKLRGLLTAKLNRYLFKMTYFILTVPLPRIQQQKTPFKRIMGLSCLGGSSSTNFARSTAVASVWSEEYSTWAIFPIWITPQIW